MDADNLQLKTELMRLRAEVHRRSSKADPSCVDYVRAVIEKISQIKGSRFAQTRYECLFDCVRCLYSAGEYQSALVASLEMLAIAKRVDRADWRRIAKNIGGSMHAESGNLSEAVIQYHECLQIARDLNDISGQVSVLGNLGTAFLYATLYREAIPCLQRGIELATQTGKGAEFIAALYSNLAQCHLALGELKRALIEIRTAIDATIDSGDSYASHSRTIREWTFVDIALELQDLASAREHLQATEKYAQSNGSPMGFFLCKLARGLFNVHVGDVERGLALLHSALIESRKYGVHQRVDALVALVKAHELCGQPERALFYMKDLMQHLSHRRQQQLEVLMSIEPALAAASNEEYVDLHVWKYREARLRAAAAQHEVITARQDMLERLAITAGLKEDPSGEHGYRVGRLAALLGQKLAWPRDQCHIIEIAARLHDIGKVGIPDRILLGSQELKDAERHFMHSHTLMGAELLAKSEVPQLKMAEEIARFHHEWWSGNGYPTGLTGERIPLHARIVALADVFDALTHGRPYAAAWTQEMALAEIQRLSGTQFDPQLTDHFIELVRALIAEHHDLDAFLGRAAEESAFLVARKNLKALLSEEGRMSEGCAA